MFWKAIYPAAIARSNHEGYQNKSFIYVRSADASLLGILINQSISEDSIKNKILKFPSYIY